MKIAHFPGNFLPTLGGAEIASHNIVKNQTLAGHDITVISTDKEALALQSEFPEEMPYKIHSLFPKTLGAVKKSSGVLSKMLHMQLKKLQKKHNFDVWHFNLATEQCLYSLPYLKKMNIPVLVTCQGTDIQILDEVGYGLRKDPEYNSLFEKNILLADWYTSISNSVKEEYLQLGIPEEKISDIPNGIDYKKIQSVEIQQDVREKLGWPSDKKIILTVGRNHPKKGYIQIPDIIAELKKLRDDFLWVIVGKGCDNILEKARETGVDSDLLLMHELGLDTNKKKTLSLPTEDLILAYKSADAFAFPTLIETFGTVQVEAMAAGIPVITTDAPGARDLIDHGNNGLSSPVKDVKAMAENIHSVFEDRELYDRLTAKGLEFSRSFNWKLIAEKYIDASLSAVNSLS